MSSLSSHSAPGQALGYYWQLDLALLELAQGSTGGIVGVETLDDVAVVDTGGNITLIQSKSSVDAERNPLSDSSKTLWKTLAIWLAALRTSEFAPDKTSLVLVTNAEMASGLALRLGAAVDEDVIKECVRELRTFPAKPADGIRAYVKTVRDASDAELSALIRCIKVRHSGTGHSRGGVREQILAKCHLPDGVSGDQFLNSMAGWLHNFVVNAWSQGDAALVKQAAFANMRHHLVELQRRRRVRELPSRDIVCKHEDIATHRSSGFVRQLEIIDADASTVEDAIVDFLKHNHERLRLVKEGHIIEEDWDQFEDRLIDHWKPIARAQPSTTSKAGTRRAGTTIYNEVQKHREQLAGEATVEYYLTRGAYQRLADDLRVGWHPDYKRHCSREIVR